MTSQPRRFRSLRTTAGAMAAASALLWGALAVAGSGPVAGASGRSPLAAGSASACGAAPWTWPGTCTNGFLPANEPDTRGGGVTVGLITAGTIHDHGYYQSEVTALDAAATKYKWKTIIQGSVTAATGLSAAQNMCQQGVDLLIIGETQLAAAATAAKTPICKDTVVWLYGSTGSFTTTPKEYLSISSTTEDPQSYATGVAMGLWLKAHHQTRAGFITGPAFTFTKRPAQAFLAGMRSVVKNATLDAVFDGTMTDSGKAITAATTMVKEGITLIYPYLGGALFPTAKYIASHGGATISAGGNFCSLQGVNFAIKQVYNPGYHLTPALAQFAQGKLKVGVNADFVLGKTAVPTVAFCKGSGVSAQGASQLKATIKKLAAGTVTATQRITAVPAPT